MSEGFLPSFIFTFVSDLPFFSWDIDSFFRKHFTFQAHTTETRNSRSWNYSSSAVFSRDCSFIMTTHILCWCQHERERKPADHSKQEESLFSLLPNVTRRWLNFQWPLLGNKYRLMRERYFMSTSLCPALSTYFTLLCGHPSLLLFTTPQPTSPSYWVGWPATTTTSTMGEWHAQVVSLHWLSAARPENISQVSTSRRRGS